MKLSIIIPTFNRADLLSGCLESIKLQTFPQTDFEIIVIDNGSTDNTKQIVQSFENHFKNLRYLYESTPGLHVGRHLGLKSAQSDILVYCDDDIEAFPTWLEGIWESFQDDNVVLVGGKNLPKWEIAPPEWINQMWNKNEEKIVTYLSIIDLGDKVKVINPYFVFGCNFSIRKSIILKAKGFHPDGMPGELIRYRGDGESFISRFILENGYKALYQPKASVFHVVSKDRLRVDYFCKRAYNQGVSDSYTIIRNNKTLYKFLSQIKFNLFKAIFFFTNVLKPKSNEKFIKKSYYKGYEFHQKEVKSDRKLLEWVHKEDYF